MLEGQNHSKLLSGHYQDICRPRGSFSYNAITAECKWTMQLLYFSCQITFKTKKTPKKYKNRAYPWAKFIMLKIILTIDVGQNFQWDCPIHRRHQNLSNNHRHQNHSNTIGQAKTHGTHTKTHFRAILTLGHSKSMGSMRLCFSETGCGK